MCWAPARWPGRDIEGCRVPVARAADQLRGIDPADVLMPAALLEDHIRRALLRNAWRLVGIQETHRLLEDVKRERSELVGAALDECYTVADVADVLRELLRDGTPIRDLRGVLEALVRYRGESADPRTLADHVTAELRDAIAAMHADGDGRIEHYELDPELEARLLDAAVFGALPEAELREVRSATDRAIDPLRHRHRPPVVMTRTAAVRPLVRDALEGLRAELVVLSRDELSLECETAAIGRIGAV